VISSVSRRVGEPETLANIINVEPFFETFITCSGSLPTKSSGRIFGRFLPLR